MVCIDGCKLIKKLPVLLRVVLLCSRQLQVDVLQLYFKRDCHRDMAQLWVSDSFAITYTAEHLH